MADVRVATMTTTDDAAPRPGCQYRDTTSTAFVTIARSDAMDGRIRVALSVPAGYESREAMPLDGITPLCTGRRHHRVTTRLSIAIYLLPASYEPVTSAVPLTLISLVDARTVTTSVRLLGAEANTRTS